MELWITPCIWCSIFYLHIHIKAVPLQIQHSGGELYSRAKRTITIWTEAKHSLNTMEQEDWKKGRAFSLFLCAVLSGITLVFAFSYWFSRGGKIHISMDPLYTWEILLFLTALLTMTLIIVIRNNSSYVENPELQINTGHADPELSRTIDGIANVQQNNFSYWNRFPLRSVMYIICCLGSIVFPIFEVYRTADNISSLEHISSGFKASSVLKCLRDVLCTLFCLCQLAVLLLFKNMVCKSLIIKYLVSTLVAANFSLWDRKSVV